MNKKNPYSPKNRFKTIFNLAKEYRRDVAPGCPPSLPFVAWCGSKKVDPNVFRCQLSFVTRSKEVVWSDFKRDPLENKFRFVERLELKRYKKSVACGEIKPPVFKPIRVGID